METPLRAFLMVRSIDGTWTVTVCRDLDSIMRTWKMRSNPESDVAVLHIGFERPPSQTFEKIATAYLGRMLLTAAARYALPVAFVPSDSPIGFAENIAVYIGLQGWGYKLEDPTIHMDQSDKTNKLSSSWNPQDWVVDFIKKHPTATEALSTHGISNEESYIELESNLDRVIRQKIGVFRAYHFANINYEDPCILAKAAPPWLRERELSSLGVPVRAINIFNKIGVSTVSDLACFSSKDLLAQQHFGRKTARDIYNVLNMALNKGPESSLSLTDKDDDSGNLFTDVRRSLLTLRVRDRDILKKRLGFMGPPQTLQKIAADYGLSRERIRQIVLNATEKLVKKSNWNEVLEQKISQLLISRNFPLPVTGVEAIDPWFEGVSSHLNRFQNLMQLICKNRLHLIEIDGLLYFSFINQETWEDTLSEASELISSRTDQGWSESYVRSLLKNLLPESASEFETLLWEQISCQCHFTTGSNGVRILTSFGFRAEQLVKAILAESDTPLHFTEIAERLKLKHKKSYELGSVHRAASIVGFLYARGTYGLTRHLPFSDQQILKILNEAEDLVCSDVSDKQWHTSEILSELSERVDADFGSLDKYILDIILKKSTMLKSLGKMAWIDASNATDDITRIDIHQAVVSLIKKAGRPLSTSEIKEQLEQVRGLNNYFQIIPTEPIIRMKPGVWGLNYRDVSLTRIEQKELLEELVESLQIKQRGIHESELSSVLNLKECPPQVFISIAVQDNRLSFGHGKYVYLSNWDDPRRKTVAGAVASVLKDTKSPITFEQIVKQVEHLIDRKCNPQAIANALYAHEAKFDETNKKWRVISSSSFFEEEDAE